MEREYSPMPPEESPNSGSEPSTELPESSRESAPEKAETTLNVEAGVAPLKRPESGIPLALWNIAERIVLSDLRREYRIKKLSENARTKERLKLYLMIIERQIYRLVEAMTLPLIRYYLREYGESFDTLIHKKQTGESAVQPRPDSTPHSDTDMF